MADTTCHLHDIVCVCVYVGGPIGAEEVIAGFHGPFEADRRDELIDRAALRIHHRPLESIPGVYLAPIDILFASGSL